MLNQASDILETKTTQSSTFSLRHDGILTVEPHSHFKSISKDILELDLMVIDGLTKNKRVLFLTDNRKIYGISSEQRNYVKDLLNSKATKCAVLLNNNMAKYFFNFFNHLYKLQIPVKAFSNQKDAIEWLLSNKHLN